MVRRPPLLALACALALLAAGCGEEDDGRDGAAANARPAPPSAQLRAAARPAAADFPRPQGRSLQALADTMRAGLEAPLATSEHAPGRTRIAFGLLDAERAFVLAPTAVYVARSPGAPARGPFLAPADSMEVRPPFRSRTSGTDPEEVSAIYHAEVAVPRPGRWFVLTATRVGSELLGAATEVRVRRESPVPAVGERAPRVETPTLADAGGDVASIDTRTPPSGLHDVSLADVLGERPVALLFATPALCQTRVCGPVTDIAVQLATVYGEEVAFIHQEVYRDNEVAKGLRPQLRAYGLRSEPWLFAIDREGRVAARLEGAFGFAEFRAAIEAARRGAGR